MGFRHYLLPGTNASGFLRFDRNCPLHPAGELGHGPMTLFQLPLDSGPLEISLCYKLSYLCIKEGVSSIWHMVLSA